MWRQSEKEKISSKEKITSQEDIAAQEKKKEKDHQQYA